MKVDTIVVGSGPAGVEAAETLATAGRRVAIVSATPPGGRTTVGSLVPSKSWLHFAALRPRERLLPSPEEVEQVATEVREVVSRRSSQVRGTLERAGAAWLQGTARVLAATGSSVRVGVQPIAEGAEAREVEATHLVVATGSEPRFFPEVKPDGDRIIAPRHMSRLARMPQSLVMVGGGVTGVEYASVFARFGSRVTIASSAPLLPRSDREYVGRLARDLAELGVTIRTGSEVTSVRVEGDAVVVRDAAGTVHHAEMAFIATGRRGDLELFEGAPVSPELDVQSGAIRVDRDGRSSIPSIYACGDVTGAPLTANSALRDARRVAASILGRPYTVADDPLIEAVYTDPGIAQIGRVHQLATRDDLTLIRRSFDRSVLSTIERSEAGELKVWLDDEGRIHGAAAFGRGAADLLAPVQLAMHQGIAWNRVTAVPFAYPTTTEILTA